MIFQWKWVYHKCVKKTRRNDWRCFLGTRRKIAARILCAFQGSGRQFFTLDIVSYFPPWSNCFSAKTCLKKWMIMTPFACHWHFDCAAENLLCALLIFGSCAETKVFVIVKKNASLWRGCAHKKTGTMSDDMMPDANTGLRGRAGYAQGWQDHRQ